MNNLQRIFLIDIIKQDPKHCCQSHLAEAKRKAWFVLKFWRTFCSNGFYWLSYSHVQIWVVDVAGATRPSLSK